MHAWYVFKFWPDTLYKEIACVSVLVPRNLLWNLVTSVRPLLIGSTEVFLLVDVPGQSISNPYHTNISLHTHTQTRSTADTRVLDTYKSSRTRTHIDWCCFYCFEKQFSSFARNSIYLNLCVRFAASFFSINFVVLKQLVRVQDLLPHLSIYIHMLH